MSVNEILEAVRALSLAERVKVHTLLDTLPDGPSSLEESVRHRLYEAGLLSEIGC